MGDYYTKDNGFGSSGLAYTLNMMWYVDAIKALLVHKLLRTENEQNEQPLTFEQENAKLKLESMIDQVFNTYHQQYREKPSLTTQLTILIYIAHLYNDSVKYNEDFKQVENDLKLAIIVAEDKNYGKKSHAEKIIPIFFEKETNNDELRAPFLNRIKRCSLNQQVLSNVFTAINDKTIEAKLLKQLEQEKLNDNNVFLLEELAEWLNLRKPPSKPEDSLVGEDLLNKVINAIEKYRNSRQQGFSNLFRNSSLTSSKLLMAKVLITAIKDQYENNGLTLKDLKTMLEGAIQQNKDLEQDVGKTYHLGFSRGYEHVLREALETVKDTIKNISEKPPAEPPKLMR